MRRVAAYFIGRRLSRFGIDPPKQRFEAKLVVGVGQKIDEQRDAAARLLRVPVDRIAFSTAIAFQCGH